LKALFVAGDGGAREALHPLAAQCGSEVVSACAAGWAAQLAQCGAALLVCGTSDSPEGRAIEIDARRAARDARLPVVAVEDFPGNYAPADGADATLLVVESSAAREIALARLGARCPRVEAHAPARYDRYRAQFTGLRTATAARWAAQGAPEVLWAGQPETDDALSTLAVALPALRAAGAHLLFKAHPRDPGYASGAYARLLSDSEGDITDVTPLDVAAALARAPRLVLTQFSSVAIEAGFYGIPGVWLLLAGAGGARLHEKKGYRVPPLLDAGAAAYASDVAQVPDLVQRSLTDLAWRDATIRRFDAYLKTGEAAAPRLAARLRELA
jgi:hypothetical protein